MEEWRDIAGYEGYYQASNLGRIKSLSRLVKCKGYIMTKEIIRKGSLAKTGYISIRLSKKGIVTTHLVHILVGKTFIPNPENKPQINHIKGIKTDNRVSELEWNTISENRQHSFDVLNEKSNFKPIYGIDNNKSKLSPEQAEEIRLKFKSGINRRILAAEYGVSITTISSINTNKTWNKELEQNI